MAVSTKGRGRGRKPIKSVESRRMEQLIGFN
ncbi:hypothetical protein COLO4_17029 [Corchorus olitorius]|uniref:Uncharacterized protein n=1 Tax=Corchorus olitorius TaxID=93759 RepID=A0A1R3JEG7_9ROSI|nr:hypothetical protein COLO4_17029 [Corchorus olitorius]